VTANKFFSIRSINIKFMRTVLIDTMLAGDGQENHNFVNIVVIRTITKRGFYGV